MTIEDSEETDSECSHCGTADSEARSGPVLLVVVRVVLGIALPCMAYGTHCHDMSDQSTGFRMTLP